MTGAEHVRRSGLVGRYAALVCDLDGVVYRGRQAVAGAVPALAETMAQGIKVAFATNNASREPGEVLAHLAALGVAPHASRHGMSVVTSAEAAARAVRDVLGPGEPVLAVGGPGVAAALRAADLCPFTTEESRRVPVVRAVVQGAGKDVDWSDLAEAAYRIREGALWVATNGDRTIPTGRGPAPGNGTLVDAVRAAVEVEPLTVGKPEPALYELALERLAVRPRETLVVGDRLDTDIAGAVRLGLDSMLVLGGAHGLSDVVRCAPALRPTYVGVDLRALLVDHEQGQPGHALDRFVREAWALRDEGGDLSVEVHDWRDVERALVEEWTTVWRGASSPGLTGGVLDDPKSVPRVTHATP